MRLKHEGWVSRQAEHAQRGFTLIELVITLLVLGVLLAVAIPSFRQTIVDNRVTANANTLVSSLNIARSEAINRALSVTVAANSGTNWHLGWTVTTVETTPVVLRTQAALEGGATLVGSANSLTYASTGFLTGAAVTLDLCDDDATTERRVSVVAGGRSNLDAAYVCP